MVLLNDASVDITWSMKRTMSLDVAKGKQAANVVILEG